MTPGEPPLTGLRVLDLSQFLSGPHCTQILADLGAEVIKVEPVAGDSSRVIPPHRFNGESAYYLSVNRTKRSIVLDLKNPEGRQVLHDLVGRCDILVENFRPGVADRLGIGFDQLSAAHPGLIYCSISGFGQDGPAARRPAYDMIVQAASGTMSLTGERGGRPVRLGVPAGDLDAGTYAAVLVLAAVVERARSGLGQHLDVSMLDVQLSHLSYQAQYHLVAGVVPGPQGRGHDSIPTYAAFVAADGSDVLVCANTEPMWAGLCRALEVPHLVDDARFARGADRLRHREELTALLGAAFARFTGAEILDRLAAEQVPCSPINDVAQALAQPQVAHRGMVREVTHSGGGSYRTLGSPARMSRSAVVPPASPPRLGEHSAALLAELLDLDDSGYARLRERGAFGPVPAEQPVPAQEPEPAAAAQSAPAEQPR